jgi:hypothetical protein
MLKAAEAVKQNAQAAAHYGGYGSQRQLYAAKAALEAARSVAAWQEQMARKAQEHAWKLSQKQQAALHDLRLAQEAANKAQWGRSKKFLI